MGFCSAQISTYKSDDTSLLEFYRQYSSFTNHGEYEYLYEGLSGSLLAINQILVYSSV